MCTGITPDQFKNAPIYRFRKQCRDGDGQEHVSAALGLSVLR